MNCQEQILVETTFYMSSYCASCGVIYVYDGIYSFDFSYEEFCHWGESLLDLDYNANCEMNGDFSYLKVYSPYHGYCFEFSKTLWSEFQDMLGQTLVLLQVYRMIDSH